MTQNQGKSCVTGKVERPICFRILAFLRSSLENLRISLQIFFFAVIPDKFFEIQIITYQKYFLLVLHISV